MSLDPLRPRKTRPPPPKTGEGKVKSQCPLSEGEEIVAEVLVLVGLPDEAAIL